MRISFTLDPLMFEFYFNGFRLCNHEEGNEPHAVPLNMTRQQSETKSMSPSSEGRRKPRTTVSALAKVNRASDFSAFSYQPAQHKVILYVRRVFLE
jgi:hypothetical protein